MLLLSDSQSIESISAVLVVADQVCVVGVDDTDYIIPFWQSLSDCK